MFSKKKNVMVVGAHADDIEIGCGGTVAKHVQKGNTVVIVVMTRPEYAYYDGTVLRNREEGEEETKDGARILGAELINLDFETKDVPYSSKTIEPLNEIIDRYKIDLIYTHWLHDTHQDHMRTTKSVLSAGRLVHSILMYEPEYPAARSYTGFRAQYYIDISDTFDVKMESIRAHRSQVKKYEKNDFLNAIESRCRHRGYQINTKYAEAFEIIRLAETI